MLHRVEAALGHAIEPAVGMIGRIGQEARAHHRRRGQRDEQRDRHRHRQGDRKFPEQPPDDRAHQQDRQEDRDQRNADRNDGEADFAGPDQRRLHPRRAELHMAGNVLQHDDGVVDDEAGRNRQRHQRQIVEAEAQQIHRAERADDRHRHGDAGDRGGAQIAQEDEDDERHQERPTSPASSRCRRARCGSSWSGRPRWSTSTSPGSDADRRGSSAFTASTAWMMLAPGWR